VEINNVNKLYYTNNNLTQESSEVTKIVTEVSLIDSNTAVDEVVLSSNTVTPNSNITTIEPTVYEVTTETPLNTQNIKEILYKLHHPAEGFVGAGNTQSGEIGDAWDILQHINRESDSTVNANTGVSRAQLLKLTQKDNWEESNSNFFGNLNRVFNYIDGNGDSVLSYSELQNFSGYEFTTSISTVFGNKVNAWSADIQNDYKSCSTMNAKMNFAINKAKEYLTAMGMTDQLQALERLQNEGKIGFKDCNPGKTLTAGVSWVLGSYNHLSIGGMYVTDDRTNEFDLTGDGVADWYTDGGLFLDQTWYGRSNIQWYELTSTIIHELTHATAYLYSDYPSSESSALSSYVGLSDDAIGKLRDAGCLTDSEYNTYQTKHNNGTLTEAEYKKLVEMTEIMWGEYMAYQTDEDFEDSIGYGDYDGIDEADEIDAHIKTNYTGEPEPDDDWWITYYKNNKISYNA